MDPTEPDLLHFGPFTLLPRQRVLLRDGAAVALRGREFDLLLALAKQAGDLVSNEQLIAQVWRRGGVSEANLRVQIGTLRRSLGDGRYIVNAAGRGYSLVEPLRAEASNPAASDHAGPVRPANHRALPARLTRVIGLEDTLERLATHLARQRMITITGAGGIGKTTLALSLADRQADAYADGACLVDLAMLEDASLVPATLAAAIGVRAFTGDPRGASLRFLRDRRMLLVIDNCERVAGAAASIADDLLRAAPGLSIVATSREPLKIDGEWIHRLHPMAAPPWSDQISAADALAYPSVELFVERARSSRDTFVLTDEDAPAVVEICRRLDGIPLAIELAAAHVDSLSVRSLAAHLADSFSLLRRGRRTAQARHETLRATFDWSFAVLGARERETLGRLGVFRGGFTLEAACAVAADRAMSEAELIDAIYELVAKSLVDRDETRSIPRYRLLETTRVFALEKLAEMGTIAAVARRHAEYCLEALSRAEADWPKRDATDWKAVHGRWIDDIRAAIDWCYGPGEDPVLGAEITARSAPLAIRLALLPEYLRMVERALEQLGRVSPAQVSLEVRLRGELIYLVHMKTVDDSMLRRIEAQALESSEAQSDARIKLAAFRAVFGSVFSRGDWPASLDCAERTMALALAPQDREALAQSQANMATAKHMLGDQDAALALIEAALQQSPPRPEPSYPAHARLNTSVAAMIIHARILWVRGYADQAEHVARVCLEHAAVEGGHGACSALGMAAIPIAIFRGDDQLARAYADRLADEAARHKLERWRDWSRSLERVLELRASPDAPLSAVWPDYETPGLPMLELDQFCALDQRLATPAALARIESGVSGWCAPELLRASTEVGIARGRLSEVQAEPVFRQSLAVAARQNAAAWGLRTATSLAGCLARQGRRTEARGVLEPAASALTEGFDTADYRRAQRILAQL